MIVDIAQTILLIIVVILLWMLNKKDTNFIQSDIIKRNKETMEQVKVEVERVAFTLDEYKSESRIKSDTKSIDNDTNLDKLKSIRRK